MEVIVSYYPGFDWSAAAAWIGGLATAAGVLLAYREVPRLRREMTQKDHLTNELAQLWHVASASPDDSMRLPSSGTSEAFTVHDVRVGSHAPVFERFVIEFQGRHTPTCLVAYEPVELLQQLDLAGGALLSMRLPSTSVPTDLQTPRHLGGDQFLQAHVHQAEDALIYYVSIRTRANFFAFCLAEGQPRIAVDVAL